MGIDDADDSYLRVDSFRLPYVGVNGQENVFSTRILMESPEIPPKAKSDGVIIKSHYRSQSAKTVEETDKLEENVEEKKNNINIPMSSHQVGLIQTSQELDDI